MQRLPSGLLHALTLASLVVGCGSTSTSERGGSSASAVDGGAGAASAGGEASPPSTSPTSDPAPRPKSLATARARRTGDPACSGDVVLVGSFDPSRRVEDGEMLAAGRATVTCRVKPHEGAFLVAAKVAIGETGAGVMINGLVARGAAPGTVDATFVDDAGDKQLRGGCAVTYPEPGGVAGGRVWANVMCPAVGDACAVAAEVRFENCAVHE